MGYVLKPGFMLPPLMFTDVEIEALVLGSRWIGERADDELAQAARRALSKISNVLPADLKRIVDTTNLIIGPSTDQKTITIDLGAVRRSIREEKKVEIAYSDDKHKNSQRIIWPFALAFFDSGRIIIAWCELRQDFRHFRADRIMSWAPKGEKYPRRRNILLKEWRQSEGIGEP
jgi:predicted DNA-binding transcriptional regulator YafY